MAITIMISFYSTIKPPLSPIYSEFRHWSGPSGQERMKDDQNKQCLLSPQLLLRLWIAVRDLKFFEGFVLTFRLAFLCWACR